MQFYCTLFNSSYLSRGLSMYYSLEKQTKDFHFFLFAFDDNCLETLKKLELENATIVSLTEFENPDLLNIKSTRTTAEYCWTCASSSIWYCIHTFDIDHCTYVDADLLFFSDPKILVDEMGSNSILLIEHRYHTEYDLSATSGLYCVQFITFKRTEAGLKALDWWRKACIDWCFNRYEEGKFGDQKYLDDWLDRFEQVHILRNWGGGVAPWNSRNYSFEKINNQILVKNALVNTPLVFYHFHDFRYCTHKTFRLTNEYYMLHPEVACLIYANYAKALAEVEKLLNEKVPGHTPHEALLPLHWLKSKWGRYLTFEIRGYYKNYYKKRKLINCGRINKP